MKTDELIRLEGFNALFKALGPIDTIRFLQQYEARPQSTIDMMSDNNTSRI